VVVAEPATLEVAVTEVKAAAAEVLTVAEPESDTETLMEEMPAATVLAAATSLEVMAEPIPEAEEAEDHTTTPTIKEEKAAQEL
jgi:hypothetical protein